MISEEELINNYYEAKRLLEMYEDKLIYARKDAGGNFYYQDDIDDKNVVLGLEFQIDRLKQELAKMENYATENNIILVEPSIKK